MMSGAATITALREAGLTCAAAESLTGGMVCAALSEVPGSSAVFRGGAVTYTVAAKQRVLGVPPALLAEVGPVDPQVALLMARGVADLLVADVAVATTGVAGPAPHGGHDPGVAFIAWAAPHEAGVVEVHVDGGRESVRTVVTHTALTVIQLVARDGDVDLDQLSVRAKRADRE